MLIMNKEKQLLEWVFMDRELNMSVGRKLITTPLDVNDNIIKTDKLAHVMEVALSLDKVDNTDNLEDGRLNNVLLRYHVTGSEEFKSFEPITHQYNLSVNSKPDHSPWATPGNSHIPVAPGVGFSLFCLSWGSALGVLNKSKSSIIF